MGPYSGDVFLLDGFIVYEGGVVVKRGILAFLLFLCLLAGGMNIQAADSLPYQKAGSRKEMFTGKGWQTYKGKKYYIASNGKKVTGWRKIGNYKYYFKKNGVMVSGRWVKVKGKYRYFGNHGKMKKGWMTLPDGRRYYLDSKGARVTGDYFIKNKGYHFSKGGVYQPEVKVRINPEKPMIALTFDDGPGPYTDRLLKCLKKNHAVATFFLVGSRKLQKYRKECISDGV